MPSPHTPPAATSRTPPLRTPTPGTSTPMPGTIQPSRRRPHISPSATSASSPQLLSPTRAVPIRRRPQQVAAIDAARLFDAVSRDDAEAVMRLLDGTAHADVRHPQTGETLVLSAARSGARRTIESLAHDARQSVVDEPVSMRLADGALHDVRATHLAAMHAQAFGSTSMSLWQLVEQEIELHESSGKERFKSGLRGWSQGHTRRPSGGAVASQSLEDKAALMTRLDALLGRIRPWIQLRPAGAPVEIAGANVQPMEFLGCDVKAILKQEREALETLRPSLQRWSDFIHQLVDIGARPTANPSAGAGTLHDAATLDREGDVEPLLQSLIGRFRSYQGPGDPGWLQAAGEVLHSVMDERTRTGASHRPTEQQVLLAQTYFERLPDDLLQDSTSLTRHLRAVLELADEAHGGRPALLEKMASALIEHDTLMRSAAHTRHLYGATSWSTEDQRADTQAVAVNARQKLGEAANMEQQALRIVRGACERPSPRIDDLLQQAAILRSQADAAPGNGPIASDLRSRAEALERQADALDGSRVRDYRVLKQYLALEASDPADLTVHPGHLMAACLRLARQYADHRDGFGRSAHRHRDVDQPDELLLRHAERQVLRALDHRLAEGLVGPDLPNAQLYRPSEPARPPSLPSSSPGRQHLFTGRSPLFSLGKRPSPGTR